MTRGQFITLEGIDGGGKSTQAKLLLAALEALGLEVVQFREPGGSAIAEKIRELLLDPANDEMVSECELLLFEAGRAQNVRQIVEPALARGAWVLADRFYDSTYAYQMAARGLDEQTVELANALGSCGRAPDLTLVFDLEPEQGAVRRAEQSDDRIEAAGLAFQARVREGYLALAEREPSRVRIIDAVGSKEEVHERVMNELFAAASRAGICLQESGDRA